MAKKKPTPPVLTAQEQRFLQSYGIDENTSIEFFTRQPNLLLVYMVLSLGAYGLYWHYRNWEAVRVAGGRRMWPLVRAFFAVIFAWPLFKIMILQARARGFDRLYSGGLLAVAYVIPAVVVSLIFRGSDYKDNNFLIAEILVSVISLGVLLFVQNAVIWNNPRKQTQQYDKTTPVEILCIGLLCVLPLLLVTFSKP